MLTCPFTKINYIYKLGYQSASAGASTTSTLTTNTQSDDSETG